MGPNPENSGTPKQQGPTQGGALGGAPKGGETFRVVFSVSRPHFRSFCLSLGVFSWFFGGVWWCGDHHMCTFGVLGLSCEAQAVPKPPWFHTTTREPKSAHLRVPVFTKTTKNSTRRHTVREIQSENGGGRGKKERNFGWSGGKGSGGRGSGKPQPQQQTTHNNTPQHTQQQHKQLFQKQHRTTPTPTPTPTTTQLAESGLAKIGLAKIG